MKYKFISLIGLALILTTSCQDYLEVDSPSAFSKDYVFSNTNDTKKTLMSVYSLFGEDPFTSRMSNAWMQNTDVEVTLPSANPDGSRRDIWTLQASRLTGFGDVYKAWQNNFLAIDRANQCIEGIKQSTIADDPDMKMMLGEAYCLKAYRYYLLCNFWGDVPYFANAAKAGMQLDVPKTDKNYIYSASIQDLVNCEEDMYFADQYPDGIERMNREFSIGMISRLALFRAGYGMTKEAVMKKADEYLSVSSDEGLAVTYTYNGKEIVARTSEDYYQLASNYCQKLMSLKDRQLNPDFQKIFRNECEYVTPTNDDVLYEVAFLKDNGGDVGWCIGTTVLSGANGKTTTQIYLTPTYYFSFDDDDTRRDISATRVIHESDTEVSPAGISALASGKWNRQWAADLGSGSSKGTGINWPLMRYSEILLMLAEAENEINNGPNDLAKEALKRVRQRAFPASAHATKVDDYTSNLGSKDEFFNAIVDERAWEFGGECLRKFNLGRWNIYGQKIVEMKKELNNIGQASFELNMTDPEVSKYANYADYLYVNKQNGITFLNSKYRPEVVPELIVAWDDLDLPGNENAYARVNWGRSLYKYDEDESGVRTYSSANYTEWCWRGYTDMSGVSAVPYLIPLSTTTVGASAYLTNDGYGVN